MAFIRYVNGRMIVDYEVADVGNKWHLSVMSMAGPAQDEND